MRSAVSEQVESYIGYKRGLGVEMVSEASALRQLARFAGEAGHEGPIDAGLAVSWATSGGGHDRAYECKRYELARRVTDYRAALGAGEPRLAPGLLGSASARVTPYIYTDEEVSLLMRASAGLYSQDDPMRPPAMEVLVGLMRSTGVRPSEALSMADSRFDGETQAPSPSYRARGPGTGSCRWTAAWSTPCARTESSATGGGRGAPATGSSSCGATARSPSAPPRAPSARSGPCCSAGASSGRGGRPDYMT